MHRHPVALIICGAIVFAPLLLANPPETRPSNPSSPNVIFITIDTLRVSPAANFTITPNPAEETINHGDLAGVRPEDPIGEWLSSVMWLIKTPLAFMQSVAFRCFLCVVASSFAFSSGVSHSWLRPATHKRFLREI